MATTLPVIRGRMGSVDFYLATMKASEAISKIRVADEIPEWENLTIEEKTQRELNWKRIRDEIGQYIATDQDRFYAPLLVAIYTHSEESQLSFESLNTLSDLPKAYESVSSAFGFLHLPGSEILFALDGQHRLKGTEIAITGKDQADKAVEYRKLEVSEDDIGLVLIPFNPKARARKIFNKVNRYAKPTSKGDNIITSEDDINAIIARRLIGSDGYDPIIPEDLVNWKSNSIAERSQQFTMISILYEGVTALLHKEKINTQFRPTDEELERYYQQVSQVWKSLLHEFEPFKDMMEHRNKIPELRKQYICFKPAVQTALMQAITMGLDHGISLNDIINRLNGIDWRVEADIWKGIIMIGNKIRAGGQAIRTTGRLIAHLIGACTTDEQAALLDEFVQAKQAIGENVKTLPNPIVRRRKR